MNDNFWHPLLEALNTFSAAQVPVYLWLRDDDAVSPTPALDRLTALVETYHMPCLLAVIPELATQSLADFIAHHPWLLPCQHGFAHRNHAATIDGVKERAVELGGVRATSLVIDELHIGQDKLRTMFGDRLQNILVPPWNRISPEVLTALHTQDYATLSTFGAVKNSATHLRQLNSTLDVIDWRGARSLRNPIKLLDDFISQLTRPFFKVNDHPVIGLLTHHLVHDDAVWDFLEALQNKLSTHHAVKFVDVATLQALGVAPCS